MLKKHVVFLLALAVIFSNMSFAYGDSSQLHIDPSKINKKSLKESVETNVVQLEQIQPRGLNGNEQELEIEKEGKIHFNVQEEISKLNDANNEIPVQIFLTHDDDAEDKFSEEIKLAFGEKFIYEKVGYNTFNLLASPDQLRILESMPTVDAIYTQPKSDSEVYISDSQEEREITPFLNASTEMMGIKKARSDFKVSGDLDGKESSYSSKDVAIAIVDTGIDANHVDLDGGKVIGWYDVVNGKSTPYDDEGHGTHVASIAAGTGEGDPGIQTGVAPGAALVGVKVLNSDGEGTFNQISRGLEWVYKNLGTYNIKVVNISIGTQAPYSSVTEIISIINKIKNAGVPVFVAAGNEGDGYDNEGNFLGKYYDTLSTFAKYTSTSVGSVKDPYEGGWGLSEFSSRGTGSQGPYVVAPGQSIRAAKANSKSEYESLDGTSMSSPMVAGIFALMYDAAYSKGESSTISFSAFDMGQEGYDKLYGNGNILGYESIKNAAQGSGSFDNYRTYIRVPDGYVQAGSIDLYEIYQDTTTADFNLTLLITDENMENLDLAIWEPGADPYQGDPSTYYIHDNTDLPQESFSIKSPKKGVYYIGVFGVDDSANYTLEITGNEIKPN
ncbi:hypothetical protein EHV15_09885 [Paenibacillus oralis]|uniref:Peptidase S8/S53 domain-containing protein n=1 Tax=Paenibacillus oralis TaxID=2490856 RepID=A0A3P3TYM9_9BACL|nr:S8 family serine peptidase [Paenibacillus oralis]RRJ63195.1 hypothetical protein EHV15_09885 [Paenibacillus oralis]